MIFRSTYKTWSFSIETSSFILVGKLYRKTYLNYRLRTFFVQFHLIVNRRNLINYGWWNWVFVGDAIENYFAVIGILSMLRINLHSEIPRRTVDSFYWRRQNSIYKRSSIFKTHFPPFSGTYFRFWILPLENLYCISVTNLYLTKNIWGRSW